MKMSGKYLIAIMASCMVWFSSCSEDTLETTQDFEISDGSLDGDVSERSRRSNRGRMDDLSNEVLTSYNELFLKLDRYAYGMRPNATARAIAYINLAAYETAVPFMRNYESNDGRLDGLELETRNLSDNVDVQLALNAVYADVVDHFLINVSNNAKDAISILEEELLDKLSIGKSQRQIDASTQFGAYVADQVITYSKTDLAAESQILEPQPSSYEPPVADGYWTYSADPERALFPYWGKVRTFVISSEETTSIPPVPYSTDPDSDYFDQMREVYEINNSAKANQDENLWIAEFWSDDVEGLMMSPPGRQVSIANQLIINEELNLQESLILMLKLGFSLNDAAVSTWADKYEHMVMRPNVFIHEFIDPGFQTNLYRLIYWPNPSFPGYPSGHSCFASAAAGVFIDKFGDSVEFTDESHDGRTEFLGNARTFNTLSEMAEENAFSRVPLGVHISMDCSEGLRLGYEISDAINDLSLRRRSS